MVRMDEAMPATDFARLICSPAAVDSMLDRDLPIVVVDLDQHFEEGHVTLEQVRIIPSVIVGITDDPDRKDEMRSFVNVVVDRREPDTLARIRAAVGTNPNRRRPLRCSCETRPRDRSPTALPPSPPCIRCFKRGTSSQRGVRRRARARSRGGTCDRTGSTNRGRAARDALAPQRAQRAGCPGCATSSAKP